jgi:hypothetical protein
MDLEALKSKAKSEGLKGEMMQYGMRLGTAE